MRQKLILDENNLAAIESLLAISLRGIHQLFEHSEIARILSTPTEEIDFFNFKNMDKIQELFLQLIECGSFAEKRDFLENLDNSNYEIVLRAYFHIVENTALAAYNFKH